jgi:hypothetical protein
MKRRLSSGDISDAFLSVGIGSGFDRLSSAKNAAASSGDICFAVIFSAP